MRITFSGALRPQRRSFTILRAFFGLGACALLLGTAACGPQYDPLTREGLYVPAHTNRANLTLMVANPGDLVRGTGVAGGDGQLGAAAIDRLRNDKLKKLPASDISQITTSNSGDNNSTGGGGQ